MVELLKRYLKICLLNKGPQDLPYSHLLFQIMLLIYFVTGSLSMWPAVSLTRGSGVMLLDVSILLIFCWVCLIAFNQRSRFIQTAIALTAVGSIFQILTWPLLFYVNEVMQVEVVPLEISLLLLVIISWNLAAYAHIFRQAYEIRRSAAFALTLAYVVINLATRSVLFPDLGV